MRDLFGLFVICLTTLVVVAQVQLQTPVPIGSNSGYGYSFAIEDGNGNIIVASNPAGDTNTLITKSSKENPGVIIEQLEIPKSKGRVMSGCISTIQNIEYLFIGLSTSGYAARVNLSSFSEANSLFYLNATEAFVWSDGIPKTFASAVCLSNYVYFGTMFSSTSNTIVRLDINDENMGTRFRTLNAFASGDLTFASKWGEKQILFLMEPHDLHPVTLFLLDAGDNWSINQAKALSLSNFEIVRGLFADYSNKKVLIANGNGEGKIVSVDLSQSNPVIQQELTITLPEYLSPINSFVVDQETNYAYITLGSCESSRLGGGDGIGFAAIRLLPNLAQDTSIDIPYSKYDCLKYGLPSYSLLLKQELSEVREVIVFTQLEYSSSSAPSNNGVILPVQVFPYLSCAEDCHSSANQGFCASGKCYCQKQFGGDTCEIKLPCQGTNCSGNGVCDSNLDTCQCEQGWMGDDCSTIIPCLLDCSGKGKCEKGVCQCNHGYTGAGCNLRTVGCQVFGDCHGNGICQEGYPLGSCQCFPGYLGDDCLTKSNCYNNCSGHGYCGNSISGNSTSNSNKGGICICEVGWIGDDCSITTSPCPNNCSLNGVCRNSRCTCFKGYKGVACALVDPNYCPSGCSEHGTCIDQICICDVGYTGTSCSKETTEMGLIKKLTLSSSEHNISTSFIVSDPDSWKTEYIVYCFGTIPPKCVSFNYLTLLRKRLISFQQGEEQQVVGGDVLLQDSEGTESITIPSNKQHKSHSILPEFTSISTFSMVEVSESPIEENFISVSVIDPNRQFSLIATSGEHPNIFKVNFPYLTQSKNIVLNNTDSGITAACAGPDGLFYFASGKISPQIIVINSDLQIISQTPFRKEIKSLHFDDQLLNLFVRTKSEIFSFKLNHFDLSRFSNLSKILIPNDSNFTSISTILLQKNQNENSNLIITTSSVPPTVFKANLKYPSGATFTKTILENVEDSITSSIYHKDIGYFVLSKNFWTKSCEILKYNLTTLTQIDSFTIHNCSSNIITSSLSEEGTIGYFSTKGESTTASTIYSIQLSYRNCNDECGGIKKGQCSIDHICSCEKGWTGETCSIKSCLNDCSSVGICVNGICDCPLGYSGDDCSISEICSKKCLHGTCIGTNNTWPCECIKNQWKGIYCSEQIFLCPNNCSSFGVCENQKCVCNPNYKGDDCSQFYGCRVDSDCGNNNNKVCAIDKSTNIGSCECAPGHGGDDCSKSVRHEISAIFIVAAIVSGGIVVSIAVYVIWKHSSTNSSENSSPEISKMEGGFSGSNSGKSRVGGGGGYTRIPRRLIK